MARSTFYILEGVDVYRTWVAWHGASRRRRHPFSSVQTRRRGARAYRISLINVHTEPLAVILPAYPPRRPRSRSSRRTISRIAIPSPMRNDATLYPPPNSRHYRPTLKYGATIVSLSLSLGVSKIEQPRSNWQFFCGCGRERHLGCLSSHSPLFSNGALTRRRPRASKRCSTARCVVEEGKRKRRRKEAECKLEKIREKKETDRTTAFAQPAAPLFPTFGRGTFAFHP